jgi:hypothetical protein
MSVNRRAYPLTDEELQDVTSGLCVAWIMMKDTSKWDASATKRLEKLYRRFARWNHLQECHREISREQ